MQLQSEVSNLSIELKGRYSRVIEMGDPVKVQIANEVVAAVYALSCGSVVVALNAAGGKGWRKVMIDKKGVKLLAMTMSGIGMLDKILYNIDQFVSITTAIKNARSRAMMNRYMAEWQNVVDSANVRLHLLTKGNRSN